MEDFFIALRSLINSEGVLVTWLRVLKEAVWLLSPWGSFWTFNLDG